jgi:hypothetical protein
MRNTGSLPLPAASLRRSLQPGVRRISTEIAFGFGMLLLFGDRSAGEIQWTPPPSLRNIPVRDDCAKTNGAIGLALQPTLFEPHGAIFVCLQRAFEIDRAHPGASFFFRVHEYGHLALHTRNEALADSWAAEQLSHSVSGRTTLNAVFSYFNDLGKRFAPMYGTGFDRALTVADAGQIPQVQWPGALAEYQKSLSEKRARNGTIQLRTNGQTVDGLLWIDDELAGFVSTAKGYRNPPVPNLLGLKHRLRLQDVWVSENGALNKLIAKGIDVSALFQGDNSADGLVIKLNYESESLTISVSE